MSKGAKRRQEKERRRTSRQAKRGASKSEVRSWESRTIFAAKERIGDKAEVRIEFSSIPVPFDEAGLSSGLRELTALANKLAAKGSN